MTAEYNADRRLVTDGGTDQQVTRTVTAKDVVTREVDDEEREVLRVPISSTREDREGDAFAKADLERRAEQIREQQPLVFDDHGMTGGLFSSPYSARDTIGTQFDAELEEDDDGYHTLYAFVNPDHSHEEGARMLSQVRDEKQAIKFSVGFRVLETADDMREEDRPERANEVPGRLFTRTDLMETSRVGIPANPDASASVAAKGGPVGAATPFPIHPAFARMMGLDPEQAGAGVPDGVKAATDGGRVPGDELAELRSEVSELRDLVETLADDGDDDDEDEDDDDEEGEDDEEESASDDGGDGEGDDDGEDDEDEEDDDEGEEESASADLAELRSELSELRKSVQDLGDPETADTSTRDATPTDDEKDETPDETASTDTDTEQRRPATDFARGN